MTGLSSALRTEVMKAAKSKVFFATVAAFVFMGIMLGLLMFVANDPALAGGSSAIEQKASRLGDGDWPSYLSLLLQAVLALGPLAYGIVTAWVFGREYSDHTAKDLLALPTPRASIVVAKLLVVAAWAVLITLVLFSTALLAGLAFRLPGWSSGLLLHTLELFAQGAALTILLCPPIALVASAGKGYLLPIGVTIALLILTQLVGMGMPAIMPYFPWAIPAVTTGIAGSAVPPATATSYLVLVATCIAGIGSTLLWWERADQV